MAMASSKPLIDPRTHVLVDAERVSHVSSTDYPGVYPGELHDWDLDRFKQSLHVAVKRLSQRSIEFDLVGVDASVANALRRILLAEVPAIAVEYVYVWNNTSVMVDEVLSQRIGLVPIDVDPALIEFKDGPNAQATDRNTLVFKLHVQCTRRTHPRAPPTASTSSSSTAPTSTSAFPPGTTDEDLYEHSSVLASDLVWVPQGEQASVFAARPPRPTNGDIVLTKLRPGQEVELEAHAFKGVAKDHAKWSPVATASYRLLPHIALNPDTPVPPHLADRFARCFAPGVITVDARTKRVSVDPAHVRRETMSREVLRHPEFEGCVALGRKRDHFIFNVESEGFYAPERLPLEAIHVMRSKIATLRDAAQALLAPRPAGGDDGGATVDA